METVLSHIERYDDIRCDGDRCDARARMQVGLRAVLRGRPDRDSSTNGWLFVKQASGWRHYCPACASAKIVALSAGHAAENSHPTVLKSVDGDSLEGD